jgi:Cu+-exporting ATPase
MVQEKIVLGVPGLRCASCVPEIERAVRAQEGVIWAILIFAAEQIIIIYDRSMVSPKRVVEAVQKLGLDPSLKGARVTEGPKQHGHESRPVDALPASPGRASPAVTPYEQGGRRSRPALLHK